MDEYYSIPTQQEADEFAESYCDLMRLMKEAEEEIAEKKRQKKNFEARFQRWCDKMFERMNTRLGKCGMSLICDYCDCDHDRGRTCVRALNALLKETRTTLDYSKAEPHEIWEMSIPKAKED